MEVFAVVNAGLQRVSPTGKAVREIWGCFLCDDKSFGEMVSLVVFGFVFVEWGIGWCQ